MDRIDKSMDSIDKTMDSIDETMDSIDKSMKIILKYLGGMDKYLKSSATHGWVKSLTICSGVSFLLLTGLSKILTPARVFQTDLLSLVAFVFASCFGMTFKSYGLLVR